MTSASITHLEATTPASSRPTYASHVGLLTTVLLVVPAVAILLAPFAVLAAAAIEQPAILIALSDMPLTAAQLGLGLIISALFCVMPFYLRTADIRQPASAEPAPVATVKPSVVIALAPRDEATATRPLAA